jgi:hypothetical protein
MAESLETRPGLPPLRIYHFLVAIAVAAALLSIRQTRLVSADFSPLQGLFVVHATMAAVGLTAAVYSIFWWWKGYAALSQPGQWMLLIYVPSFLYLVGGFLWELFTTSSIWQSPWQQDLLVWEPGQYGRLVRYIGLAAQILTFHGLPLMIFVWGAWRIADTRPWRAYFAGMALFSLLEVVIYLSTALFDVFMWQSLSTVPWMFSLLWIVNSALIVWAVVADVFAKRSRYWTHWLGVLLAAGGIILNLVSSLVLWLFT